MHDGALTVADVTLPLIKALESASPFGRKNAEPLFLFRGIKPSGVRTVGNGHLKCVVEGARHVEMIAFGAGEREAQFAGPIDVLASPMINEYRGQLGLQLRVRDIR